ncbi:MAG: hypothetical protein V3R61_04600, partial [candidate division NC10 bacterium]
LRRQLSISYTDGSPGGGFFYPDQHTRVKPDQRPPRSSWRCGRASTDPGALCLPVFSVLKMPAK